MKPRVLRIAAEPECTPGCSSAREDADWDRSLGELVLGTREEIFALVRRELEEPGGLVAIPTETVYGLAGSIYSEQSLSRIFEVKQRPRNDPLIVHVDSFAFALRELYDVGLAEAGLILYLASRFAPGPLTIVARCSDAVSSLITNGTPSVAVRCPRNELCLALLRFLGVPLAAPSANKFGHISPTCPRHVLSEFPGERLCVLDGGHSQIGIESTVVKVHSGSSNSLQTLEAYLGAMVEASDGPLEAGSVRVLSGGCGVKGRSERMYQALDDLIRRSLDPRAIGEAGPGGGLERGPGLSNGLEGGHGSSEALQELLSCEATVEILRRGAVTKEDLRDALEPFSRVRLREGVKRSAEAADCESPGSQLKHYAPYVPTYLVLVRRDSISAGRDGSGAGCGRDQGDASGALGACGRLNGAHGTPGDGSQEGRFATQQDHISNQKGPQADRFDSPAPVHEFGPGDMVLVDVGARFKSHAPAFRGYIPLASEAAQLASQLYSVLRRAESLALAALDAGVESAVIGVHYDEDDVRLFAAIGDRLARASSGRVVHASLGLGGVEFALP